jgi:hypothetical protein
VQWDSLCMTRKLGGLGIMDLQAQNSALLLRWLWTNHASPNAIWPMKLRSQMDINHVNDLATMSTNSTITSLETYKQSCHCLILRCKFHIRVLFGFDHLQGNIHPNRPISSLHTGESNFLTLIYPGNYI